jgi:hypothetical protein
MSVRIGSLPLHLERTQRCALDAPPQPRRRERRQRYSKDGAHEAAEV